MLEALGQRSSPRGVKPRPRDARRPAGAIWRAFWFGDSYQIRTGAGLSPSGVAIRRLRPLGPSYHKTSKPSPAEGRGGFERRVEITPVSGAASRISYRVRPRIFPRHPPIPGKPVDQYDTIAAILATPCEAAGQAVVPSRLTTRQFHLRQACDLLTRSIRATKLSLPTTRKPCELTDVLVPRRARQVSLATYANRWTRLCVYECSGIRSRNPRL